MKFNKTLSGKELFGEVKKVLDRLTASRIGFTKHDVTQEVRKNVGDEIEVLHSDVRLEVENLMPQAYQDYDSMFDPTIGAVCYLPVAQTINPTHSPVGHVTGPAMPVTSFKKASSIIWGTDSGAKPVLGATKPVPSNPALVQVVKANKKGVCIPKRLVKEAQKRPTFTNNSGRVAVCIDRGNNQGLGTSYQPDQYGNITILNRTLGGSRGDLYELTAYGDTVHVKKAK